MKLPISLKIVTSSATVMLALNSVSTTEAARRCRLRATSGYSTPVSSNSAVSPSTAHLSPVTPSTPVHAQQQQQQRQYQQKQQPQQQQPQQKAVVKNTFVAPAPAPVQSGLTADQAGVLAAHNAARAVVGVAPLKWSAAQQASAQQTANNLVAGGCNLIHDRVGQNLYMSSGSAPQADAVHAWMNEGYAPGSSLNHASQCLWSGSTQVGCASASGACGTVIACDYDPVGNFVGESAY